MKKQRERCLPWAQSNALIDSRCTRCGACLSACPVYDLRRHERFSPRGKEKLISESSGKRRLHPKIQETLEECLQCGACTEKCSAGVDVMNLVRGTRSLHPGRISSVSRGLEAISNPDLRPLLHKLASSSLGGLMTGLILRIMGIPNPDDFISGLLSKKPAILSERITETNKKSSLPEAKKIVLFLGCIQNYLFPEVIYSILDWMSPLQPLPQRGRQGGGPWLENGIIIPEGQGCCGLLAWSSGYTDVAKKLAIQNIKALEKTEADHIVTGCASCAYMIKKGWPELFLMDEKEREAALKISERTWEFSDFLSWKGISPIASSLSHIHSRKLSVSFHVPCHQRYGLKTESTTESYLKDLLGEAYMPISSTCCGGGGAFSIKRPGMSREIWEKSLSAWKSVGADILVTTCSGCLLQWKAMTQQSILNEKAPHVLHLAELLSRR